MICLGGLSAKTRACHLQRTEFLAQRSAWSKETALGCVTIGGTGASEFWVPADTFIALVSNLGRGTLAGCAQAVFSQLRELEVASGRNGIALHAWAG